MKLKELFEYIDWEQIDYVQINEVDDYKITTYKIAKNERKLLSLDFLIVFLVQIYLFG